MSFIKFRQTFPPSKFYAIRYLWCIAANFHIIERANKEVKTKLTEKCGKVCTLYMIAAPEMKASSYTAKNGMTNAVSISTPNRVLILQEIILCC